MTVAAVLRGTPTAGIAHYKGPHSPGTVGTQVIYQELRIDQDRQHALKPVVSKDVSHHHQDRKLPLLLRDQNRVALVMEIISSFGSLILPVRQPRLGRQAINHSSPIVA